MKKLSTDEKMQLFVSDHHGVYVPQVFAECATREKFHGISDEDWKILETHNPYGEESEILWETWEQVLSNAYAIGDDGKWTLYQDGDLWLIHESFTEAEWEERFGC